MKIITEIPDAQQLCEQYDYKRYSHQLTTAENLRLRKENECRMRAVAAGRPLPPPGRLRVPGGGRKSLLHKHPDLIPVLYDMLEPGPTAEYAPPFQWSCFTDREVLKLLDEEGVSLSATSVPSLLKRLGMRRHPAVRSHRFRSVSKKDQFDLVAQLVPAMIRTSNPVLYMDIQERLKDSIPMDISTYDLRKRTMLKTAVSALESSLHPWNYAELLLIEGGGPLGINDTAIPIEIQRLVNKTGHTVILSYLPPGITRWEVMYYCERLNPIMDGETVLGDVKVRLEGIDGNFETISKTVGEEDALRLFDSIVNLPSPLRNWNRVFLPANRSPMPVKGPSLPESTEIK